GELLDEGLGQVERVEQVLVLAAGHAERIERAAVVAAEAAGGGVGRDGDAAGRRGAGERADVALDLGQHAHGVVEGGPDVAELAADVAELAADPAGGRDDEGAGRVAGHRVRELVEVPRGSRRDAGAAAAA